MARWMRDDTTKLYRVVVVERNGHKTYYGPYERKASAGWVRSYMTKGYWHRDNPLEGWIEETQTQWYQVDD